MPDTEVILIRHGETEWNVAKRFQGHKDSDLTENGKQQVEALGTRFPVSYTHLRAHETR